MLVRLPEDFSEDIIAQAQSRRQVCWVSDQGNCGCDYKPPQLVIVNLDDPHCLDIISALRQRLPQTVLAVVTTVISVRRITEAIRRGAATVVARPTTLGQVVAATYPAHRLNGGIGHDSLDVAIWKYLNQIVAETGSIAGAARRLRLDRTSLKRMLRNVPNKR